MAYEFLRDPKAPDKDSPVYIEYTVEERLTKLKDIMDFLYQRPQPILADVDPTAAASVRLLLCTMPRIIAGYSPHNLGRWHYECAEVLRVLAANSVPVTLQRNAPT